MLMEPSKVGARIRIILVTTEGSIIEQSFTLGFLASNNEAEYKAVLAGLRAAITLGVTGLKVHCESSLVVNQINGEYVTRDSWMEDYLQLVLKLKFKIS